MRRAICSYVDVLCMCARARAKCIEWKITWKNFNRKITFRKIVFYSFTMIWCVVCFSWIFSLVHRSPLFFALFKKKYLTTSLFLLLYSFFDWFPFIHSLDEIIIAHYSTFFFIIIIDLQIIAFTFLSFNRKKEIHTHTYPVQIMYTNI